MYLTCEHDFYSTLQLRTLRSACKFDHVRLLLVVPVGNVATDISQVSQSNTKKLNFSTATNLNVNVVLTIIQVPIIPDTFASKLAAASNHKKSREII